MEETAKWTFIFLCFTLSDQNDGRHGHHHHHVSGGCCCVVITKIEPGTFNVIISLRNFQENLIIILYFIIIFTRRDHEKIVASEDFVSLCKHLYIFNF